MIVGRVIPPDGQDTSTHMFARAGRNMSLPTTLEEFEGAATVDAAKAFLERAFGIGDLGSDAPSGARGRATVRHVTPYLFVTMEVIYSESVLLHGLEKVDKARDIVASMPYFLRATDEASVIDERRLRGLQRALDTEEAAARSRAAADTALKQRAFSLLAEAHRIGIATQPSPGASEGEMMADLRKVSATELGANSYPSEGEFRGLHDRRTEILAEIANARRRSQATRSALREATSFGGTVARQRGKLMLAEHLHVENSDGLCPVCSAPSERGRQTAQALQHALLQVRSESIAVERVKPRLAEHDRELEEHMVRLNADLRRIDDQIQTWLRQTDETRRLTGFAQLQAHLLGRISYFLEASVDERQVVSRDLTGRLQAAPDGRTLR